MLKIKHNFRPIRCHFTLVALLFFISCVAVSCPGCGEVTDKKANHNRPSADAFNNYWFQGLAEISRFGLEQARYGEIHKGDGVLIYVTEEFLTDKQVKSELGKKPGAVSVLKLNFARKFHTGIYPYSMMSSVFTPVNRKQFPQSLKVTTSVQEWCGQTFTQLNFRENQYHIALRSYFMDEGDRDYTLDSAQLEDDIWTLIRLDPNLLKTGEMEIIPGSQFSRLKHMEQKVEKAHSSLIEEKDVYVYAVSYRDIPRKLVIKFKMEFPYQILEWEETSARDKGPEQSILTTKAVRTHVMLVDYWNKKSVADLEIRKKLGLK